MLGSGRMREALIPSERIKDHLAVRAVEVEGVTKGFGTTLALDDVSFTVEAGRVLALLGPNGAGKTTLIRAQTMPGWLRPSPGTSQPPWSSIPCERSSKADRSITNSGRRWCGVRRFLCSSSRYRSIATAGPLPSR
jgi:ABC-type transport system involved in cytochrome bd biosynthesis fused ATPase/permease subunit